MLFFIGFLKRELFIGLFGNIDFQLRNKSVYCQDVDWRDLEGYPVPNELPPDARCKRHYWWEISNVKRIRLSR